MSVVSIVLIILVPLAISYGLSVKSYRALMSDELLGIAPGSVKTFIYSRGLYWLAFGILVAAFALALMTSKSTGEATRAMIARGEAGSLGPFQHIISSWGLVLLPVSIITIFVSLIALFMMGRAGLKRLPEDTAPGPEFIRARARFFFLGFSLMLPPLLFSLLLAL